MDANPRVEAEKRLIDKAFEDAAFKKELVADPKAVLQREFGADLPDDLKVDVLEITPEKTYLVIPQAPPANADLPDEEEVKAASGAIVLKAWKDEVFKKDLLSDPRSALNKAFNLSFPDGLTVEAVEETQNQLYITLPLKHSSDDELSDEQLEAVAGGECIATGIGLAVGGIGFVGTVLGLFAGGAAVGVDIFDGADRGWI